MKKIKTIDVALYIFILTALGYYVTFSFNWGYNNYFLIPMHLIDFSIFNMTKSISLIGIGLSTILVTIIFFLDKTDVSWLFGKIWRLSISRKTNFFFQGICLICLLIIIVFSTKETDSQFYIFYFWATAIICSLYFYLKKYSRAMIVAIVVSFFMFPHILGIINASNQTEFFILDEYPDHLILTFSNEKIIAAKFDSEANVLLPEFKILPMNTLEESNNDLRLVKISKLLIEEPNDFNRN